MKNKKVMKLVSVCLGFIFLLSIPFPSYTSAATYTNQDVTAYTGISGRKTYHGTVPRRYITAAVHPAVCYKSTSGTVLKKGTIITSNTKFSFPDGKVRNTFTVEDMGDVKCDRGLSRYFFDIYFGVSGTADEKNAGKFEEKKTTYTTK
ncbi:hypothetical protein [Priestia megaterium]|uniref:hypothetical protein n=1 Tax=Priestia megaterium TaxID=1404 RepID=UPI002D803D67|nr:hypothetical protein [Priestia megaterium]MEB4861179.1 hypothetical protein [Priestia megaterium]